MPKFLILAFLMFSSVCQASFSLPSINWSKLTSPEKEFVISELQRTLGKNLGTFDESQGCIVAGWPSKKEGLQSCQLPDKQNPHYDRYIGCPAGQALCNPALFGDGQCIDHQQSKDNLYNVCLEEFVKNGKTFSSFIDHIPADEFNEIYTTLNQQCSQHKATLPSCLQLKERLEKFLPNEIPFYLKEVQTDLKSSQPEKLLKSTQALQREMEKDMSEFWNVCEDGISQDEQIYCKNLSMRVKKANSILPKAFARLETTAINQDCANCSKPGQTSVLSQSLLSNIKSLSSNQCVNSPSDEQKCTDAVMCTITSSLLSPVNFLTEGILKQKPASCMNSQNSCVTNIVSSIIKSLLSLVTGIWDLLSSAVDWSGEKISHFWDYVTGVEDKTSDAQNLLNKMSDAEVKEVKTNPIQWVKNLTLNMWNGIKEWIKEDIFCEKWAGVPRMSRCEQPSSKWDCMGCQTKINGICSAAGVVLAEVVPAFLTGGTVSMAAKAGTGTKVFVGAIKASRNYKKTAALIENLTDVKAVQVAIKVGSTPINAASYTIKQFSKAYSAMTSTQAFQKTMSLMDTASKYTGLKAINQLNTKMYAAGYSMVDKISDGGRGVKFLHSLQSTEDNLEKLRKEVLKPLYDEMFNAYEKGSEVKKIKREVTTIKKTAQLSSEDIQKITELEKKSVDLQNEITEINNNYLNRVHNLYQENGIPSKLVKEDDGSFTLFLDFAGPPSEKTAFEFYRRVKNRFNLDKVKLSLKETAERGTRGYFAGSSRTIEMGPNQGLSLLEDYFNSTSKHESRHSMFFHKRKTGDESIFHTKFYASIDGHLLNEDKIYEYFMSAEELYTFSTDLQSLAQAFQGTHYTVLAHQKSLLNQISSKTQSFKKVINSSYSVSDEMIKSLDQLLASPRKANSLSINPRNDGNWSLEFYDKFNRRTELTIVVNEQKVLAENYTRIRSKISDYGNKYVEEKLRSSGADMDALTNRIQNNQVTTQDRELMNKFTEEAYLTPAYIQLLNELDESATPLIHFAKTKMTDLRTLAEIQRKEALKIEDILKQYPTEEKIIPITEIEKLKDQMFKTAKNVKEDYKGFALDQKATTQP